MSARTSAQRAEAARAKASLEAAELTAIRAVVTSRGLRAGAKALGLSEGTILRALAVLPLSALTVSTIRARLAA